MLKNKAKEETREAQSTSLRALVEGKKAEQIFVADDIPKNALSVETVNIQTFEEKFNIHYTESVTTGLTKEAYPDFEEIERFRALKKDRRNKSCAVLAQEVLDTLTPDIGERLKKPLTDAFILCNMEKQASGLGYGLFARKNIPEGVVVGIYAGEFIQFDPRKINDDYAAVFSPTNTATDIPKLSIAISAKNSRNLLGFVQHLPSKEELESWGFILHKEANIQLATENLSTPSIPLVTDYLTISPGEKPYQEAAHASPFIYLRTCQPIYKNEMIGFSYGILYWINRHIIPNFFDKNGQTIPSEKYLLNLLPLAKEHEKNSITTTMWLLENFAKTLWEKRNYFDVSEHLNDLALYYYQIAFSRRENDFVKIFSLGETFLLFSRYIAHYPEKNLHFAETFLKRSEEEIRKFFSSPLIASHQKRIFGWIETLSTDTDEEICEEIAAVKRLEEIIFSHIKIITIQKEEKPDEKRNSFCLFHTQSNESESASETTDMPKPK